MKQYTVTVTVQQVTAKQATITIEARNEKAAQALAVEAAKQNPDRYTWTDWPLINYYLQTTPYDLEFSKNSKRAGPVFTWEEAVTTSNK